MTIVSKKGGNKLVFYDMMTIRLQCGLSKLTVKITPETGFAKLMSPIITLKGIAKDVTFKYTDTAKTDFADYDLGTSIGDLGSVDASVKADDNSVTYEFMIPTQKIENISFTANGLSYSYTGTVALVQGQNTTLT